LEQTVTTGRIRPLLLAAAIAVACLVLAAVGVLAVSGGGYDPASQDCGPSADANNRATAQPGCHNAAVRVGDGGGHTYADGGTYQQAQGDNVHSGNVVLTPSGQPNGATLGVGFDTGYQPLPAGQCALFDVPTYPINELQAAAGQGAKPCALKPASWRHPSSAPQLTTSRHRGAWVPPSAALLWNTSIYFGADDNLNSGEHDGVDRHYGTRGSANGPSDGGSLHVGWHPLDAFGWLMDVVGVLRGGSVTPVAEDPVPVANAGGGGCADGICFDAETRSQVIYHGGGGSGENRDVYDYSNKTWDPYACGSGDAASERACVTRGGSTMDGYRKQEARNVNAQPGVQVYEDPDPQTSPVGPAQAYPLPAVYVGTCGVVAGGGVVHAPASPVTNHAGQVAIRPTGC
jgi:hypothetical protein